MKKVSIILLCLCLTGCVALMKPQKIMVSFDSNPPGATVLVYKTPVGKTPVKVELPDGVPYDITFQEDGYAPIVETIGTHEDTFWLVMTNVPLPLIGMFFGTYFTNVATLDKTEISYDLVPVNSSSNTKSNKKGKKNKTHGKQPKSYSLF